MLIFARSLAGHNFSCTAGVIFLGLHLMFTKGGAFEMQGRSSGGGCRRSLVGGKLVVLEMGYVDFERGESDDLVSTS